MKRKMLRLTLALMLLASIIVPILPVKADTDFFTVVVLPGTQFYSKFYPATFYAQTQWIADNKNNLNIIFVSHLGDLVENYEIPQAQAQWDVASAAMHTLEVADIPYGISPGNHDMNDVNTAGFDATFPNSRYAGYS